MGVAREIELKLTFDPSDRDCLAEAALAGGRPAGIRDLHATYYDTGDHALRAAGYSLRLRLEDGRRVQTIKGAGPAAGLFDRSEWEHGIDGDSPVLDPATDPLHAAVGPALLDGIGPVFQTLVTREKSIVRRKDARIEVAIDSGELIAGAGRETLCELELELLSGDAHRLFAVARQLDAVAPLRLSVLSKAERGYRLTSGIEEKAIKAEPVDLSTEVEVGGAFARIAQSCIRQFRLNEDIFLRTGSPESLHQMRVGIRRLRSALVLFRPVLKKDPAYGPLALGLKGFGAVLGELRDLDVLMALLGPEHGKRLAAAREDAREKVAAVLGLAQTRHLILDLAEWLALGDWRVRLRESRWADATPARFAAHALRRCRRKLKWAGKNWAELDDMHRHRVRKEAKTLRYAVEFFASLFAEGRAGSRRTAFREALEDLQDALGVLNDLAVAPALLARFGMVDALPPPSKRKRLAMIDVAGRKLAMLLDAKRFWT